MSKRRTILKAFLSTSLGAFLVTVLYPVIRFLKPPTRPESAVLSVVAAQSAELSPNSARIFKFGTRPAIVLREPGGKLRAFSAICTHLNCTLQ